MCFCKIEKLYRDEELVLPNRPKQPASRLSSSSQSITTRHNLSSLPSRLEPFGAVQSYPRPRTVELRTSVSQERVVVVETITPCPCDSMFPQRPRSFAQGLPKDLQRGARPLSIAESNSQLGLDLIHAKNPRQSNGMVAVITPRQSGSVARSLVPSGRQSSANYYRPRQSATSFQSACCSSQRERRADVDEENSASTRASHRRDEPRR